MTRIGINVRSETSFSGALYDPGSADCGAREHRDGNRALARGSSRYLGHANRKEPAGEPDRRSSRRRLTAQSVEPRTKRQPLHQAHPPLARRRADTHGFLGGGIAVRSSADRRFIERTPPMRVGSQKMTSMP